jgi:hypothetical protein
MEHALSTILDRRCGSTIVHRLVEPLYLDSSYSYILFLYYNILLL